MFEGPYSVMSDLTGCVGWALAGFCYIGGLYLLISIGAFIAGLVTI